MAQPGPRRRRSLAAVAVALAVMLGACSSMLSPAPTVIPATIPAPTATLVPTALITPVPTPGMTFRPLTAADLGEGWTLIATDSNQSGIPRIDLLGNVKVGTAFAFECVGTGTATVSFAAAGGTVTLPPEGAHDFFTKTYTCPALVQEFLTNAYDQGGVSISPGVAPSDAVTYQLIVGTQPG